MQAYPFYEYGDRDKIEIEIEMEIEMIDKYGITGYTMFLLWMYSTNIGKYFNSAKKTKTAGKFKCYILYHKTVEMCHFLFKLEQNKSKSKNVCCLEIIIL